VTLAASNLRSCEPEILAQYLRKRTPDVRLDVVRVTVDA
jgi:hypothetical protein